MSHPHYSIPRCPAALAGALRVLPLLPLSLSMTAFSRKIARGNPGLLRRLGEFGRTGFVLDPIDLPVVICLNPNFGRPNVRVMRGPGRGDARISGQLAVLLGLVHGVFDGDALFFSRDLVVEGDTGAVLALRNAIDDAELNLAQEIASLSGPLAQPLLQLLTLVERQTGLHLTRQEEFAT
ncbi:ubiquinone anaerobic biosynthesis accessory factor UbiT [Roseibium album]|uniref:ubiquinone anaerobic biosynthesis accessory factor UbiT n=1 Tax=Roseibium album TaxID=311410 RepID=UPI001A2135A8|nr:SCP2 sterol-binding domain-containing protein [Roseibium album]MBG6206413.1 putative lipid carrier protein YhbT [Labrenzia sp. EL_126]